MSAHELSNRQREVLIHASRGRNAQTTGARMHIAENTVRVHRQDALRRLGAHSMAEAVAIAVSDGMIPKVERPKKKGQR